MYKLIAVIASMAALGFFPDSGLAQDRRASEQLKEKGVKRCAETVSTVTEWLYGKESFAFLNTWHQAEPDRRSVITLTSKPYGDGSVGFTTITTTPNAAGKCDATFTQAFAVDLSCTSIREKTFKDWKRYGEIAGIPAYEDPATSDVVVTLAPTKPSACLVVKSGVFFFK